MIPDPVCSGKGWLWQDAYHNQMKCWRCAGTGRIPTRSPVKEPGPIKQKSNPFGSANSEENTWGSEDESTQDA